MYVHVTDKDILKKKKHNNNWKINWFYKSYDLYNSYRQLEISHAIFYIH